MLLKILLGFLCGVCAMATENTTATKNTTAQQGSLPLLLVSFDGFRADYLRRFPMPNLKLLYSEGVLVEQLTNVFITKTFPNHYSLVTGLYAESHGILASNMYDPVSQKYFHIGSTDPMWWNEARPIWVSAQDSGYKTAAMMWPGSEVNISNHMATHYFHYNPNVTFQERLGNVTNWIQGDGQEQGVMFAALYWEEPDRSGHIYGPDNTTAMSKVLKEVDDNIGLLVSELKRKKLWGRINIMVTSDHGMAQCSAERLIQLDKCVHPDNYTLVDLSPVTAIIPKKDQDVVFEKLKKCHPNMTAYLKKAIPDRLHYRNNERIQPIILIADEGWTIIQRGNTLPRLGDHGYDNSLPSMHPFLAAVGPSFRKGYRISSLQSVDVYPLMCHLLSVPPEPNNGTLTQARCMLAAETCWDVPLVVGMVVGVLLVLTTITGLFRLMSKRRPSGPRPFQRLQVDYDDDDDDPLLE
ncbi:bis(5'-adenosyl)-triphosphatase enpp4 [Scomber japonicus]|uniref:bis(5'-adenosyl)-triphosphatase enpp4 n=1 Tax=Scomber japonicus TaxID=13676 RepID=UPI0023066D44|nr:bis(5'-adenosyl)-triphosphatase enpp4 [Scomber japonicus]